MAARTHLLGAEALHLEFPAKLVLDEVTLGLADGDRVGVVGRNGDGKSSLLRMLAGMMQPDSGRVTRRAGVTVGVLDQADTLDEAATAEFAVVGDRPAHEWASDPRIREVLRGLLEGVPLDALVGALSGGQRRRVALAALLVGDWDVLLLDEPTNHLDMEGIGWLAGHLSNRWLAARGALVVVTHDRWFLDAVCTTTWEVHDGVVDSFDGGYAAAVLQRVERDRQAAVAEGKRQSLLRKELAWLRRGAPARTSKPKFRMAAAAELVQNEPSPRDQVQLSRAAMQRLGRDVVDLVDVGVSYPGGPVLEHVDWLLAPGERTGILGANGAGKSTLLSLIAGQIPPTSGRVKRGKTVRIGELSQRLVELEQIEGERVMDVLGRLKQEVVAGDESLTPAQLLERLGFRPGQLGTRVRELSGGQRRRLQLLLVLLEEPNVLLLDEPTNDLDIDALTALEDLLDTWPGTLLVVSHDRYLLERVTDQQYAILGGRLRHLPGGVDEYLRLRAAERSSGGDTPFSPTPRRPVASVRASKPSALSGAERRSAEKDLSAVERRLARAADAVAAKEAQVGAADPADYSRIVALSQELARLQREQAALEEQWLRVGERLEQ